MADSSNVTRTHGSPDVSGPAHRVASSADAAGADGRCVPVTSEETGHVRSERNGARASSATVSRHPDAVFAERGLAAAFAQLSAAQAIVYRARSIAPLDSDLAALLAVYDAHERIRLEVESEEEAARVAPAEGSQSR